jgi:hypothetical protein
MTDLVDDIRKHLQTLPPHVAERRTADLLTQSLNELERLRAENKLLFDDGQDRELYVDKLEDEIERLRAALRDCMSYIDVDNLTMQTKHRNWQRVLDGGEWKSGNVEIEP